MRNVALMGVLVLLAALPARPAHACSCLPPPPPQEALNQADLVFGGVVTNIKRENDSNGFEQLRVKIRVERLWTLMQLADAHVEVVTAGNSAACGFHFEEGERYLVYAGAHEGDYHVSLCSRTARWQDAEEDLEVLGGGEEVQGTGGGKCGGPTNAGALQAVLFTLLGLAFLARPQRS